MTGRADDGIGEQGTALKRRGIFAAAGVAMAGIAAKQTAQSVAAVTDGDVVAGKSTTTYSTTVVTGHEPGVPNLIPYGFGGDVVLTGDASTLPEINLGTGRPYDVNGIKGIGIGAGAGVVGLGGGDTSTNPTGFPIGVRGSVPVTASASTATREMARLCMAFAQAATAWAVSRQRVTASMVHPPAGRA